MTKNPVQKTIGFLKKELQYAEGGHDFWHAYRVWKLSKKIAQEEGENVDMLVVELSALLHDIADTKFYNDEELGPKKAREFLQSIGVDDERVEHIVQIIKNISWKTKHERKFNSKELQIVQDADRLDAMGAIGIARAFNYGGYKNRPLYDPEVEPNLNNTYEEYKKAEGTTLNHFYEKLLLLKDKMNTKTGKKLAKHRHRVLHEFVDEFLAEWEGRR